MMHCGGSRWSTWIRFARRGIWPVFVSIIAYGWLTPASVGQPAVAVYVGSYTCVQGLVALRLEVLDTGPGLQRVIFEFGPLPENPNIPSGEFLMSGHVDSATGTLNLIPGRWLEQPPGYGMVGLSGTSSDHGMTFAGPVTGARGCGTFRVTRSR